jgi:hypothetical protein
VSGHWLTRRTGLVPTAPPAARLSKQSVLQEATRPAAPEPDPDVTFTRRGLAVGQHLIDLPAPGRQSAREERELVGPLARYGFYPGQV